MANDPEIQAMSDISDALSNLEASAAERVLRWAVDKYATSDFEGKRQVDKDDKIENFSNFIELFEAASPSTEYEKVLVASFWFQEIMENDSVEALSVNNALKNLGHGIGNITREFNRLQKEEPTLVMQVQKKGSSKQARKEYKVTYAGIKKVKNMVSES